MGVGGPMDMRTASGVLGPRAPASFYCPISMVRPSALAGGNSTSSAVHGT